MFFHAPNYYKERDGFPRNKRPGTDYVFVNLEPTTYKEVQRVTRDKEVFMLSRAYDTCDKSSSPCCGVPADITRFRAPQEERFRRACTYMRGGGLQKCGGAEKNTSYNLSVEAHTLWNQWSNGGRKGFSLQCAHHEMQSTRDTQVEQTRPDVQMELLPALQVWEFGPIV